MGIQPRLTAKWRENLARLTTNAATVILGGLVIGPFVSSSPRPQVLLAGLGLYFIALVIVWFLES